MKVLLFLSITVLSAKCSHIEDISQSPYIIGGKEDAKPTSFPYMVSIQTSGYHNCGGVIISPTWVLTAAHCNRDYSTVVAGMYNLREDGPHIQRIPVKRIIPHSGATYFKHDIALVFLAEELQFNEYVKRVTLPKEDEEFFGKTTFTGWGRTNSDPIKHPDVLQYIEMPLISVDECNKRFQSIGNYIFKLSEVHVCTLPETVQHGACYGDGGGPLVQYKGGEPVLVGIYNGILAGCGEGLNVQFPNVFARVSKYIDFIQELVFD